MTPKKELIHHILDVYRHIENHPRTRFNAGLKRYTEKELHRLTRSQLQHHLADLTIRS